MLPATRRTSLARLTGSSTSSSQQASAKRSRTGARKGPGPHVRTATLLRCHGDERQTDRSRGPRISWRDYFDQGFDALAWSFCA
jgi:hypothetical protein